MWLNIMCFITVTSGAFYTGLFLNKRLAQTSAHVWVNQVKSLATKQSIINENCISMSVMNCKLHIVTSENVFLIHLQHLALLILFY